MKASGRSSMDDYETGSPPMVDLLRMPDAPSCVHGARSSAADDVAAEALDRDARLRAGAAAL